MQKKKARKGFLFLPQFVWRCKAPSVRGLSAQPTGGEKTV